MAWWFTENFFTGARGKLLMANLFKFFKRILENSEKTALYTENTSYSFKEINFFSAKITTILKILGINLGDRVVVIVEKSEFNLFLYLACLRSGFIYVPLNNAYTESELDFFFSDVRPKIIICSPDLEKKISKLVSSKNCLIKTLDSVGQGSFLQDISKLDAPVLDVYDAKDQDVAAIIYTSGTTGKPKGAMLTHSGLYWNAIEINQIWKINQKDTVLHMLPLFHVHGLFFSVHTAFLAGSSIIFLPKFNLDLFFKYVPNFSIFMGIPTHYARLLKDNRLNRDVKGSIRVFISGSAPLLPSISDEFYERTGFRILERYGMTETGINTSNPISEKRKIGTVGKMLPSVKIRIVDDDNKILSANKVGNIQIKSKNLFLGYWGDIEKTASSFTKDGYFITGDLGLFDEDGYLNIMGRSKDLIITGGINVYPKEIELTIEAIPGVEESAVIGVPHPDFGEAVIAIVVSKNERINENNLMQVIKEKHTGYKCPKKIFIVNYLPKNSMGKIQKKSLKEIYCKTFYIKNGL